MAQSTSRFLLPKTADEEEICCERAVPKSTKYKNKWAASIFEEWQRERTVKVPVVDVSGIYKDYDMVKVQSLDVPLADMDPHSLNYWLAKFVQEVAKTNRERYPPKTLYQIVCGLRRQLLEKKPVLDFNFLDGSDKRFAHFRRVLDAEMKDGTRAGLSLTNKREEKLPVTEEEEKKFWDSGIFGMNTAKGLLNVVYFYNGKLFGLRGGEHRNMRIANFEIGENYIRFEENASKTFHGGLLDLKYEPRVVRHMCHLVGEQHHPCLAEYYKLYIGLVQSNTKEKDAFYFKPNIKKMSFDKMPLGINTLNRILPDMCAAAGIKRKTAHCLRVTCASSLFNAKVDSKLIRERTGHRSDALLKYEKANESTAMNVSAILGPKAEPGSYKLSSDSSAPEKQSLKMPDEIAGSDGGNVSFGNFNNCTVNFHFTNN